MNKVDRQYLDLMQDILDNGTRKQTRAGEVISVFDRTMRFDLKEGLPLLTTKKVFTKGCIHELLWFLKGDTNIKYLVDNGVNIWTDDAYRYYKEQCKKHNSALPFYNPGDGYTYEEKKPLEKDDFITNVTAGSTEQFIFCDEKDGEFYSCDYRFGDLGDIYGKQWRSFGHSNFDQIQHIVDTLRTNPDDRRMLCVAFNPDVLYSLEGCALPPCHVMFQFYSRELRVSERIAYYNNYIAGSDCHKLSEETSEEWLNNLNIPKRELNLAFIQRSVDFCSGESFNLLSYSSLLLMMCKVVDMIPGEMVQHAIDVHIYANHIDGAREQLSRKGSDIIPKLKFTPGKKFKELSDFEYEDFIIEDYHPDPIIKFQLNVG